MLNITADELKDRFPALEETGIRLTLTYSDLLAQAIELELITEEEVKIIEIKNADNEYDLSCLIHMVADVLTMFKAHVTLIQVPKEKLDFDHWVQQSADYPKVVCYDAFVDVFMSASAFLNKELQ